MKDLTVQTPWIEDRRVATICARHEAFWRGELDAGPLLWITVPDARPGISPAEPAREEWLWTDVEYVMAKAEFDLAHTYYAGDALPVFNPWLGPDQFAAWLGADLWLKPRERTSWARPFVDDWEDHPEFHIDRDGRWWKLYLEILRASVEVGQNKWVTTYPDLHTGIDAMAAMRGPEKLMFDMIETPAKIHRVMGQMTRLWKEIVDEVSTILLPAGQGTSNWTMGWSRRRFLCIGQNDFSCLISPEMFAAFCYEDIFQCVGHADCTLYHLDGPGALPHLPRLLEIERLDCIQWIQGAGNPLPSRWLELLRRIQAAGKSVQLYYAGVHGGDADLEREIDLLCQALDPRYLFLVMEARSIEAADSLVGHVDELHRFSH